MVQVVLKHGTDPKVQELAEAVIKAQEGEIAMMRQSNGMTCAKANFVR